MYTINEGERQTMIASQQWRPEGVAGYCYPTLRKDTVALYRYRKGDAYFYTTKPDLGAFTVGVKGRDGYISEGIACFVPVKHAKRDWISQWRKDLDVILGDTPANQEDNLATSIFTYLENKYSWRDW